MLCTEPLPHTHNSLQTIRIKRSSWETRITPPYHKISTIIIFFFPNYKWMNNRPYIYWYQVQVLQWFQYLNDWSVHQELKSWAFPCTCAQRQREIFDPRINCQQFAVLNHRKPQNYLIVCDILQLVYLYLLLLLNENVYYCMILIIIFSITRIAFLQ